MELVVANTEEKLEKIKELYLKSFPEEELKPFSLLIEKSREGLGEMLCIEEDGEFKGHALMALYKDLALLDYFAICEDKRGCGIGGKVLALLQERYADKRFLLEAETLSVPCDNKKQRQRRMNFYHRCGMVEDGMLVEVRGVAMDVLVPKEKVSFEEYCDLYRNVFGEEIYRQVKLLKKY